MDFTLAVFGEAGELQSVGPLGTAGLSARWLETCRALLEQGEDQFDVNWSGPLSHLRTKLTGAGGAAMVTFGVSDRPAAALFLALGVDREAEDGLLRAWVDSLRRIDHVQQVSRWKEPFADVFGVAERPLVVAVPWSHTGVSAEDEGLVRELAVHLAAAFLERAKGRAGAGSS